jgi:hypothetical protein
MDGGSIVGSLKSAAMEVPLFQRPVGSFALAATLF